jgi:hypothetical protein
VRQPPMMRAAVSPGVPESAPAAWFRHSRQHGYRTAESAASPHASGHLGSGTDDCRSGRAATVLPGSELALASMGKEPSARSWAGSRWSSISRALVSTVHALALVAIREFRVRSPEGRSRRPLEQETRLGMNRGYPVRSSSHERHVRAPLSASTGTAAPERNARPRRPGIGRCTTRLRRPRAASHWPASSPKLSVSGPA